MQIYSVCNLLSYDGDSRSSEPGFNLSSECKENLDLTFDKCNKSKTLYTDGEGVEYQIIGATYYTACSEDTTTMEMGYCYPDTKGKFYLLNEGGQGIQSMVCADSGEGSCTYLEAESKELGYDYFGCAPNEE